MMNSPEVFAIGSIDTGSRLRPVDPEKVKVLAESVARIGMNTPITVWIDPGPRDMANGDACYDVPVLVAGAHRLEAAKSLGWTMISAFVLEKSWDEARLWEIAENLHRADLSVQERADHIAEWVRITDAKAHCAPSEKPHTGGRKSQGINAAVRELGIDRTEAQRAVKIASIPPEAREAADEAGLHTQKARLEIAKADDPVAKVAELRKKAADRKLIETSTDALVKKQAVDDAATLILDYVPEHRISDLLNWLNAGGASSIAKAIWRQRKTGQRGEHDRSVFDATSCGRG